MTYTVSSGTLNSTIPYHWRRTAMGALLNDDDDELSFNSIYLAVLRVKIELCMFFYASA